VERPKAYLESVHGSVSISAGIVRINDGFSEACQIGRGVRQGYSLSPLLYIIYDEAMMKEATENVQAGISVGGTTVSLIRY